MIMISILKIMIFSSTEMLFWNDRDYICKKVTTFIHAVVYYYVLFMGRYRFYNFIYFDPNLNKSGPTCQIPFYTQLSVEIHVFERNIHSCCHTYFILHYLDNFVYSSLHYSSREEIIIIMQYTEGRI